MNRSTITTAALVAVLSIATLGASTTAMAEPGWVDGRQAAQRARIRNGVHSGALTHRESKRLRRDQRRIARLEDRLGADGRYSRRDRRVLDRALDRASDRIARAKHNDGSSRHRGGRGHGHGRGAGHRLGRVNEVHHYYEAAAEPEVVETAPSYSRSVEFDLNGVRVIWNASGLL